MLNRRNAASNTLGRQTCSAFLGQRLHLAGELARVLRKDTHAVRDRIRRRLSSSRRSLISSRALYPMIAIAQNIRMTQDSCSGSLTSTQIERGAT